MSGKAPAFQFYPGDWTRDLDDYDIEIEGAWIRLCCRLWWSPERGKMTKTLKEYSKILRKSEKKTMEILNFLLTKGISSGSILDNQNITIISRRMVKDNELSIIRQRVGRLGGNPGLKKIKDNLVNQTPNQNATKSASLLLQSSSSSSSSKNNPLIPLSYQRDVFSPDYLQKKNTAHLVIEHLNKVTGKNYEVDFGLQNIIDRLYEGRSLEEFIVVINKKVKDPRFNKNWMRPHTLFTHDNFEKYLCEDEAEYFKTGIITEHDRLVEQAKKVAQDGRPFPEGQDVTKGWDKDDE